MISQLTPYDILTVSAPTLPRRWCSPQTQTKANKNKTNKESFCNLKKNSFKLIKSLFIYFDGMACGISRPELQSTASTLGEHSLNHWTIRDVLPFVT